MEETRHKHHTLQVVEFIEKYRNKIHNKERIDYDHLLFEFNRLTNDEKEALILSVIRDNSFDIKEYPDLYNEQILIESKRRFISVVFVVFLTLYFIILYGLADTNSVLSRFLASVGAEVMAYIDIIFL